MDASSRNLLGLISEINIRYVVPVYQRPYSWDTEQCLQLWNDVIDCGRKAAQYHFTGSLVTIRDGEVSPEGVSRLLLIDGQQRMTTFMLMLIALARYSLKHPDELLPFSSNEIVFSGFLTNHFRRGADHYKLTLSKGDRASYQALVDSVERDEVLDLSQPGSCASRHLRDNLELFDNLLESLKDPGSVWIGLRRLEVVDILLTQGRDQPQLIFESMNSTGKDLSTADLVRNYVLMDYPLEAQDEEYRTLWAPVEEVLSSDDGVTYDESFDAFLRAYLTATCAPRSFAHADLYGEFKRYIVSRRYNENNRIRNFALKFRTAAEHFAALRYGRNMESDAQVEAELARINALNVEAVHPLVLVLLDARDRHAVSTIELKRMLCALESYLVRRSACDDDRSSLAKFFSSLIARLDAVFDRGGNYAEAFFAMLRNEDDGPLAFPRDDEFLQALETRDAYYWQDCHFVLARLELGLESANGGHGTGNVKASERLSELLTATVEHVVFPQSDAQTRTALAEEGAQADSDIAPTSSAGAVRLPLDDARGAKANKTSGAVRRACAVEAKDLAAQEAEALGRGSAADTAAPLGRDEANRLGNLTLSWQKFDLQDDDFAYKKERLGEVPQGKREILLNRDIASRDSWDARSLKERGSQLAETALKIWPLPQANEAVQEEYRPRHRSGDEGPSFGDLFDAGLVKPGDELVSANPSYPGRATVLFDGSVMLATGEKFDDPQLAYRRLLLSLGVNPENKNGWLGWRRGEGGPLLDELREALQ